MFWIKLALFVLIVFGLNMVVKLLLRKVLKIEKEKKPFLSYNHINNLHKKIDWAMRITSVIVIIITNMLVIVENYPNYFLLLPIFIIGLDYPVRAFFERKYSQNPKQYILTLSEGVIVLLALAIVIQFNYDLIIY
ncbi:DUF4181 domain-containing protein [Paenisporosarcina antarctica]|uniref:DUF4181 domain-containing protein n=1 Tax=Paenisporosarcina antarctica TaxID=417367 RepID=A0A4P6ZZX7_9BACL|nr:DUF4181 domain-containing protein [Paenisporosarcina antarctica]QBP42062.1 DUF4181 domain-containing protein [Paenisporosarcina antarctica]